MMEQKKIKIGNKEYLAYLAVSEEDKEKGLQGVEELEIKDGIEEAMLFPYDRPQHLDFWMVDCEIPLSIIFIGADKKVISNQKGTPGSEKYISEDNAQYVLEVNPTDEIKPGDTFSIEGEQSEEISKETPTSDESTMVVLDSEGNTQAELIGGERIFSIKNTTTLIRMAKRAYESKEDSDYKALGRKVFEYINIQDERDPEYVEN